MEYLKKATQTAASRDVETRKTVHRLVDYFLEEQFNFGSLVTTPPSGDES